MIQATLIGEAALANLYRCLIAQSCGGAAWLLQDGIGAGTVADLSGNYPGTVSAAGVTLRATGPVLAGGVLAAAALNGIAGFISRNPSPVDPAGACSFSMWANCTNPAGATRQNLLGFSVDTSKRVSLQIGNNTLYCRYYDGSTGYDKSGVITTGWHHIAGSKAAGSSAFALYVDGVALTGTAAATSQNGAKLVIGARNAATPDLFFGGSIGPVMLLPAALNVHQIQLLASARPQGV